MKRFFTFFILIFSVFFSYRTAFALDMTLTNVLGGNSTYNIIQVDVTLTGSQSICTYYNETLKDAGTAFATTFVKNSTFTVTTNNFESSALLDGTFRIQLGNPGASCAVDPLEVQEFSISGGEIVPPFIPPDTQGTYNEVPLNGAVVATTGTGDVTVSFDYYLNDEQDPEHNTAEWCIRATRTDSAGEVEFCDDVAFNTYTEISHEFTGLALDSQWEWGVFFTRPGFFIDEYQILHAGSNYFWAGRFTIDSTVQDIYDAYTTCSITELAGCFQNAIVFLFYPSASSLNDFSNLYDAIKNKPPFGYISAVQTALQGINDTETGVFTLETMPILDTYIFTPMRTAIIWIMWLAFIFMFYHRLKNIHL